MTLLRKLKLSFSSSAVQQEYDNIKTLQLPQFFKVISLSLFPVINPLGFPCDPQLWHYIHVDIGHHLQFHLFRLLDGRDLGPECPVVDLL